MLDKHHIFIKGKTTLVSGNTFKILRDSRFKNNFKFYGNYSTHYGMFNKSKLPFDPVGFYDKIINKTVKTNEETFVKEFDVLFEYGPEMKWGTLSHDNKRLNNLKI